MKVSKLTSVLMIWEQSSVEWRALKQMLIYVFLFYLSLLPSNFKSYYVKNPG